MTKDLKKRCSLVVKIILSQNPNLRDDPEQIEELALDLLEREQTVAELEELLNDPRKWWEDISE